MPGIICRSMAVRATPATATTTARAPTCTRYRSAIGCRSRGAAGTRQRLHSAGGGVRTAHAPGNARLAAGTAARLTEFRATHVQCARPHPRRRPAVRFPSRQCASVTLWPAISAWHRRRTRPRWRPAVPLIRGPRHAYARIAQAAACGRIPGTVPGAVHGAPCPCGRRQSRHLGHRPAVHRAGPTTSGDACAQTRRARRRRDRDRVRRCAQPVRARVLHAVAGSGKAPRSRRGTSRCCAACPAASRSRAASTASGFGKLNPMHPHMYPFAERFGVLAAYLPGDEAFNETGVHALGRLPLPGDWSLTAIRRLAAGRLVPHRARAPGRRRTIRSTGRSSRGDRTSEPRPAWLGRLSAFAPIGDRSGLELGLSAHAGHEQRRGGGAHARARRRRQAQAVDARQRATCSCRASVSHPRPRRRGLGWPIAAAYTRFRVTAERWLPVRRLQLAAALQRRRFVRALRGPRRTGRAEHQPWAPFAGLALMEETTAFRLDWRRSDRSR